MCHVWWVWFVRGLWWWVTEGLILEAESFGTIGRSFKLYSAMECDLL
jgi:hypothetical protein